MRANRAESCMIFRQSDAKTDDGFVKDCRRPSQRGVSRNMAEKVETTGEKVAPRRVGKQK